MTSPAYKVVGYEPGCAMVVDRATGERVGYVLQDYHLHWEAFTDARRGVTITRTRLRKDAAAAVWAEHLRMTTAGKTMVCAVGCCPGCQDCYGMSIGCHQDPCRCDQPCTCDYKLEDFPGVDFRRGCLRHNAATDMRGEYMRAEPDDSAVFSNQWDACDVCGGLGPCGYDAEGRALIHATADEDEVLNEDLARVADA